MMDEKAEARMSSAAVSRETGIEFASDTKVVHHDSAAERKAIRKLDYEIIPVMTMFYLLSFLDRANIGNARVAGLQKDLHMTDRQYQICITITFVPYIAAELPSNLLLRKIGPRILMSTVLTIWGIIVMSQGFVKSYAGLATARAFLGLVEGPMFPGIVLYLSGFYTRRELSFRIALFFSAASLSGAFSGLLAAAIQQMDGIGGKPGWAWIFILEGLFSFLMGVAGYFLIPGTPHQSKLLTPQEKDLVMERLERDRPSIQPIDKFTFREVWRSMKSPQVIMVFIMFFLVGTTLYGLALFLPSIVAQLGYSKNRTQLLSVGPFAGGFVVTVLSAIISDRLENRGLVAAAISLLAVAGYAMSLGAKNEFTRYGALYLMVPGVYGAVPALAAWMSNNSEPHYRRAASIAFGFVATNSGGVLSTWRFPTKEGPKFTKTTIMNLVFSIVVVLGCVANTAYLHWRNQQKKRPGYREEVLARFASVSADERERETLAWVELGDRHPDYRYTL
ncbi:MFS general substrate transporter [Crepidotus variabilis]|uniref:MFS general substrate transporter n=1 Tax=Crepidotus variabilis TaxID=179855 RepID=A0A9P6JRE0_9AGAR|nr:MFS general substrate transporter [Crepidotus variabilis]